MDNSINFKKTQLDKAIKGNPYELCNIASVLFEYWKEHKDYYPYDVADDLEATTKTGEDILSISFANDWTDKTFKTEVKDEFKEYLNCVKNITQAFMNQLFATKLNIEEYLKTINVDVEYAQLPEVEK